MISRFKLTKAMAARLDEYKPTLNPVSRDSWLERENDALREAVRELREKNMELTIRLRDMYD